MTGRQAIEELLNDVEKPRRTKCPNYRKPAAIKYFENQHMAWYYSSKDIPGYAQAKTSFRDDSANELTKLIIAFLKVKGAFATRLNSTGIYRNDLKKFVPNTQRKGMADVIATYHGKSLNIEIKVGKDRMSKHQQKVQKEIAAAGGHYFIARNFEEFKQWFETIKTP